MKDFALIGAAGFIAPRHLKAIKETGNALVAALDKFDSVGIMDSYFPEADFFVEFERFDRHLDMLRRKGKAIAYLSVCSPNYLHDSHIRFGLRHNADVICEKPLLLNPEHISSLLELERETGRKVWNILQLRHHPAINKLKSRMAADKSSKIFDIDLTYITSRGHWYYASWKGEETKSGGIAANIGIHFFDMLSWIFGAVKENIVHIRSHDRAAGMLVLDRAKIRWFLSINGETLPEVVKRENKQTYRSITIQGREIEFSDGFTDLHTVSYKEILAGRGYGLEDAKTSIQLVTDIRTQQPQGPTDDCHPLAKLPLSPHPFFK